MLKGNLEINDRIKTFVADKIAKDLQPSEAIGILGLSFKPDSDDVRLTPSKDVIQNLIDKGYTNLFAYDPISNDSFQREYPEVSIEYIDSLDELIEKCENLVVLTGWKEFKENREKISSRKVFDFRYIY